MECGGLTPLSILGGLTPVECGGLTPLSILGGLTPVECGGLTPLWYVLYRAKSPGAGKLVAWCWQVSGDPKNYLFLSYASPVFNF